MEECKKGRIIVGREWRKCRNGGRERKRERKCRVRKLVEGQRGEDERGKEARSM